MGGRTCTLTNVNYTTFAQLTSPQVYRSAWQYAASFSASLSTPSNDAHIIALHQALIPNWTSPAFSKFVDATRALVDELANITTTRDGKEEMLRCEEIFRQICWLEQRFWPDVDSMGDDADDADADVKTGPAGMGSMGPGMPGLNTQGLGHGMSHGMQGQNMGGMSSMGSAINGPMRGNMNAPVNGPINGPMNSNNMNGPMASALNTSGGGVNGDNSASVGDGRNGFAIAPGGGLDRVGQGPQSRSMEDFK